MPQSVLVAFDNAPPSTRALETTRTAFDGADITVLHVLDPADLHRYGTQDGSLVTDFAAIQERRVQTAAALLDEAETVAGSHGATVTTAVRTGDVAKTIIECAVAEDIDHILVGSHGRAGVTRALLGSIAETVARRAPVPVTISR